MMLQAFWVAALVCLFGNIQISAETVSDTSEVVPFMADVRYMGRHRCSGVIIEPTTVLTAAQCLVKANIRFLEVAVGEKVGRNAEFVHEVIGKHIHPNYDPYNGDYDAGILKVKTPFELGEHVKPFDGPNSNWVEVSNESAVVIGWVGSEGGIQANQASIVNLRDCKSADNKVTNQMFCVAGTEQLTKDPGSPVVTHEGLLGIVSRPIHTGNQQGINGVVCGRISPYLDSFLMDKVVYGPIDQLCAALKIVINILKNKPFFPSFLLQPLIFLAQLLKCNI